MNPVQVKCPVCVFTDTDKMCAVISGSNQGSAPVANDALMQGALSLFAKNLPWRAPEKDTGQSVLDNSKGIRSFTCRLKQSTAHLPLQRLPSFLNSIIQSYTQQTMLRTSCRFRTCSKRRDKPGSKLPAEALVRASRQRHAIYPQEEHESVRTFNGSLPTFGGNHMSLVLSLFMRGIQCTQADQL